MIECHCWPSSFRFIYLISLFIMVYRYSSYCISKGNKIDSVGVKTLDTQESTIFSCYKLQNNTKILILYLSCWCINNYSLVSVLIILHRHFWHARFNRIRLVRKMHNIELLIWKKIRFQHRNTFLECCLCSCLNENYMKILNQMIRYNA